MPVGYSNSTGKKDKAGSTIMILSPKELARKLVDYTAKQLLFLDESAANERTSDRKFGWAPVGVTPHIYESIKCSER